MEVHVAAIRRTVRLIALARSRGDYAAEIMLMARWYGQVDRLRADRTR